MTSYYQMLLKIALIVLSDKNDYFDNESFINSKNSRKILNDSKNQELTERKKKFDEKKRNKNKSCGFFCF